MSESTATTTTRPWSRFEQERLPESLDVPPPQRAAVVAKLLVGVFVIFSTAALFAPWVQNIRGSGSVLAFAPDQRQQPIEATISGPSEWAQPTSLSYEPFSSAAKASSSRPAKARVCTR